MKFSDMLRSALRARLNAWFSFAARRLKGRGQDVTSEEDAMNVIEEKLEKLQAGLDEIEVEIASKQGAIKENQAAIKRAEEQRNELIAEIASLKREGDELQKMREAIGTEGEAAQDEVDGARQVYDELEVGLTQALPENVPELVLDAVQRVDGEINELREAVDNAQTAVEKAEEALAGAQKEADKAEADFQEAQAELENLPGQVKKQRAGVSNLKTAASTAARNGKTVEAYYLLLELKDALEQLEALVDPDQEADRVQRWFDQRQKVLDKKDAVEKKRDEVDLARGRLNGAQNAYNDQQRGRDRKIRESLPSWPQQEGEPDG